MHLNSKFFLIVIFLLLAGVLITGCTDDKGPSGSTATTSITGTTTPVATGPLYSAGDIVKSPKAGSTTAWLVLGYDASSDMYERAFIYSYPDGSWGYRMNSKTEKAARTVMEKVYTETLDHVDPSSIPTGPPTTATTVTPVSTTVRAVTTSSTVTATTAITGKPSIKNIHPDTGMAGESVTVTDLSGQNFATGATVKLSKSGSTDIVATNVKVSGGTDITCILPLPAGATPGSWDIVVTNPDGQVGTYTNFFTLHYNPNAVATSSSGSTGGIPIAAVDPTFEPAAGYFEITITGSNFLDGITATMKNAYKADIVATTCSRYDTTRMKCFFQIPTGSQGAWNMVLTNTNGTTGTLTNAITVNG